MPRPHRVISQEKLKRFVHYDPESGQFTLLIASPKRPAGTLLNGGLYPNQYLKINIDGVQYAAHRLAWIYMTGEQPDIVDHENELKHDNSWDNLNNGTQGDNLRSYHRRRLAAKKEPR